MASDRVISLKNGYKSFDKTKVLKGINLELFKDEILVLIGDNGAGKSTLIKCLCGLLKFDSFDEFLINNKSVDLNKFSVKSARNLGIEVVFQENSIALNQEIYRNIFATRHIKKFGLIDRKKEIDIANKILKDYMHFSGIGLDSTKNACNLSGGEKQGLALARAIYFKSGILILDEPTTALGVTQTNKLIEFLKELKDTSIILITHNFAKAYELGDRFVFLRNGAIGKSVLKAEIKGLEEL